MTSESTFRMAFWVLMAGVLLMRIYFVAQVRRAGERLMPDRDAIEREGRAMFGLRVALGKEWSQQLQLREQHHLVTTGPYRRIRHPLYTGMFGFSTSLGLVSANCFFVAFALAAIVFTFARVPKEEQMMIEAFGQENREYIQRTGRFFPKSGGPTTR